MSRRPFLRVVAEQYAQQMPRPRELTGGQYQIMTGLTSHKIIFS
jgi:hypothetical protein